MGGPVCLKWGEMSMGQWVDISFLRRRTAADSKPTGKRKIKVPKVKKRRGVELG